MAPDFVEETLKTHPTVLEFRIIAADFVSPQNQAARAFLSALGASGLNATAFPPRFLMDKIGVVAEQCKRPMTISDESSGMPRYIIPAAPIFA